MTVDSNLSHTNWPVTLPNRAVSIINWFDYCFLYSHISRQLSNGPNKTDKTFITNPETHRHILEQQQQNETICFGRRRSFITNKLLLLHRQFTYQTGTILFRTSVPHNNKFTRTKQNKTFTPPPHRISVVMCPLSATVRNEKRHNVKMK